MTQPWTSDELEIVPCDCCGHRKSSAVYRRPDGLDVVRCLNCGLHFLNPRPAASAIGRLYDSAYYASGNGAIGYAYDYSSDAYRPIAAEVAASRLSVLTAIVPLQGKRVLEIGCATGEFCAAAQQAGATPLGIDLSGDIVNVAARRYPSIEFRRDTAESVAGTGQRFDVVTAYEVIEHVPAPVSWVKAASKLLEPGGRLVLSTPNVARAEKVGPDHWTGFNTSLEHLYFFSLESLMSMMAKAGLSVEAVYSQGSGVVVPETVSAFRALLARFGLLEAARRIKRLLVTPPPHAQWNPGADLHTLMVVGRKA